MGLYRVIIKQSFSYAKHSTSATFNLQDDLMLPKTRTSPVISKQRHSFWDFTRVLAIMRKRERAFTSHWNDESRLQFTPIAMTVKFFIWHCCCLNRSKLLASAPGRWLQFRLAPVSKPVRHDEMIFRKKFPILTRVNRALHTFLLLKLVDHPIQRVGINTKSSNESPLISVVLFANLLVRVTASMYDVIVPWRVPFAH